jgi:hypothetical protein
METAEFRVAISEILSESLDCRRSSAGLRVKMVTRERTAIMEITTRSSMRVNPVRGRTFLFFAEYRSSPRKLFLSESIVWPAFNGVKPPRRKLLARINSF